jgi:hypothetical protein
VRYFNAAPDQAWAVKQAVSAWNGSGAHIRFVAVPRRSAQLVIHEQSNEVNCSHPHASVGYVRDAHVFIFPAHGVSPVCNRYWAAIALTHELGHVLGLLHEDHYCAAMNSTGNIHGGPRCSPRDPWSWRCRLLELDDIAGIAKVYGGKPRLPKGPATCPLYAAIGDPKVSGTYDSSSAQVTLSVVRPADPDIPEFIAPRSWRTHPAFIVAAGSEACPSSDVIDAAPRSAWTVAVGGTQEATVSAAGVACYRVAAVDELGRVGDAATIRVNSA